MARKYLKLLLLGIFLAGASCKNGPDNDSSKVQFTVADRSAKNIAFIVGSPNDLPGVTRDVQNVSKMIQDNNLGYELVSINYATKSQIMAKAREIGGRISENSTVFFVFSGHGTENGQLVSQNNGMFTLSEVVSSLKSGTSASKFKRFIAVIDSCFSGQSVNGTEAMFLAGGNKRDFSVENFITAITYGDSSGGSSGVFGSLEHGGSKTRAGSNPFEQGLVVAASTSRQFSNDGGASIGGVFTASLMSAIRANSTATLSQILEDARKRTIASAGQSQTPVWKATPESLLNERFSEGGSSNNVTPPQTPNNSQVLPSDNVNNTTPNSQNNGGQNPAPQPPPSQPSNPNQPSGGEINARELLEKLIGILMSDD